MQVYIAISLTDNPLPGLFLSYDFPFSTLLNGLLLLKLKDFPPVRVSTDF